MIYTTLNHIRAHDPCADGWRMLLTHLDKNDPYAPMATATQVKHLMDIMTVIEHTVQ